MKGWQRSPIRPPDLGGHKIPPIDLDAQGCRMPGVTEKHLGGLL
jgi:hypothetical protein